MPCIASGRRPCLALGVRFASVSFSSSSLPVMTPDAMPMFSGFYHDDTSRILLVIQNSSPSACISLRNDGFFTAVLQHQAHVALGEYSKPGLHRFGSVSPKGVSCSPASLAWARSSSGVRLDDGELELAATRALVLLEQIRQVLHEGVELGQTGLHVGIHLHRAVQAPDQATTAGRDRVKRSFLVASKR